MGIAGAQRLDFRIAQGGFVNVLRRAHRGFAGHDLPNELLLGFHQLIQVAVEGVLRDICFTTSEATGSTTSVCLSDGNLL